MHKKYGYNIDFMSGEIEYPDIFMCKYGSLDVIDKVRNINNLRIKVCEGDAFECSFKIYKDVDKITDDNFASFTDMNAIKIDGFGYFDVTVNTEQSTDIIKSVTGKSLSYLELANGQKVTMEINTEDDIARTDYDSDYPTLFYRNLEDYSDSEKEKARKSSFIHRLLTYAPHYKIGHIDKTLWGEYRIFSWENKDFISVLSDIQNELKCIIDFEIRTESDGSVTRYINVYDLEYCKDCYNEFLEDGKTNFRNVSNGKCNHNHEHSIYHYGEVTDIFINTENLTDSITLSSNKDSIKNMFKIKGGDDVINDAVRNINMSGDRIICFSDSMLNNMEDSLREKILLYENTVESYEEESAKLMNYIYNSYDVILYLESSKAPYNETDEKKTLQDECIYITENLLAEDSVSAINIENLTNTQSKNIVKSVTSFYIGVGYTAKIECIQYNQDTKVWTGTITIQDSEDENLYGVIHFNESDTIVELYGYIDGIASTSPLKTKTYSSALIFSDNYEKYVNDKMRLASERYDDDVNSGDILLSDEQLEIKLNQSGLSKLNAYYGAFTAVLEVLKSLGYISNPQLPIDEYCKQQYDLCYDRCNIIQEKINMVTEQISVLNAVLNGDDTSDFVYYSGKSVSDILKDIKATIDVKDENGNVLVYYDKTHNVTYSDLVDSILEGYALYGSTSFLKRKNEISSATDIENILGELYPLLCSYIREDVYENANYISDGLNNAEIIAKAKDLIAVAKRELKSACELQYNISAPLASLISHIYQTIPGVEIEDLYDKFILGNFVHFEIDEKIYRLRLSSIEFDFDSPDKLTVEFTDVEMKSNGITDSINGLINTMSSIATSYNYTATQAEKSYNTHTEFLDIKKDGLDSALINITSGVNQSVVNDDKGILVRQWDEESETYLPYQMRINNGNIGLTDDDWKTLKLAVGRGIYNNKEVYGVWANVIVGDLVASKELLIRNINGSVIINENGIEIKNGTITWDSVNKPSYNINEINELSDKLYNMNVSISKAKLSADNANNLVEELNTNVTKYLTGGGTTAIGENYVISPYIGGGYLYITDIRTTDNTKTSIEINPNGTTFDGHNDSYVFNISKDGNVVMGVTNDGDGYFKGSIYATKGEFIGDIKSGSTITCGNNFSVDKDGVLTAKDSVISGKVTATSGSIGGWIISENSLTRTSEISDDYYGTYYNYEVYLNSNGISFACYDVDTGVLNENANIYLNMNSNRGMSQTGLKLYASNTLTTIAPYSFIKSDTIYLMPESSSTMTPSDYYAEFSSDGINVLNDTYISTYNVNDTKVTLIGWSSGNNIWVGHYSTSSSEYDANNIFLHATNVYKTTSSGNTSLSDERYKTEISTITEDNAVDFIMGLNPSIYKFVDNTSNRFHTGFLAQEVKDAMDNSIGDFGVYVRYTFDENTPIDENDPNTYICGLRYEEFIAPMIKVQQYQQQQINKQQEEITELKEIINKLLELQ